MADEPRQGEGLERRPPAVSGPIVGAAPGGPGDDPDAPEERSFPDVVLGGPGFIALLFVSLGPRSSLGEGFGGLLIILGAAVVAAICFGVLASRSRTPNTRTIFALLAMLGPSMFVFSLMGRL
jgi:hypothetical protein